MNHADELARHFFFTHAVIMQYIIPPMSTAQYLLRINIQSRFYEMNCITSFLKTIYEIKSQKKRKCKQNRYSTIK